MKSIDIFLEEEVVVIILNGILINIGFIIYNFLKLL